MKHSLISCEDDRPHSALMLSTILLLLSSAYRVHGDGVVAQKSSILGVGQSFSPSSSADSFLLSDNGLFQFGFRQSLETQRRSYYLCIWYANLTGRHIVWTANRNQPIADGSSFSFAATSGRLILLDQDGVTAWSSPTSLSLGKQLLLHDTGNLVLTDGTANVVWQSFNDPTDTLLPTQTLLAGSALVSRNGSTSSYLASGNYKLAFTASSELKLSYSTDYWNIPAPPSQASSDTIYAVFENSTGSLSAYTSSNNTPYATNLPWDWDRRTTIGPSIRRLSLDFDGNLRIYTWSPVSLLWYVAWVAVTDQCNIPGICGPYAYCVQRPQPSCVCPAGFVPIDKSATWLGCTPSNKAQPQCSTNPGYTILYQVDYPHNDGDIIDNVSIETCQAYCSQNCSWVGFVYGLDNRRCWMKSNPLSNGQAPVVSRSTYVKVYDSMAISPYASDALYTLFSSPTNSCLLPDPNPCSTAALSNTQFSSVTLLPVYKTATILLTALSSILVVVFAIVISLYLQRRFKAQLQERVMFGCQKFTYKELEIATNCFSHQLGSGGFSTVFKGKIEDCDVAVKRLEGIQRLAEEQFQAEVMTLGQIHHINLVRLVGYCAEGEHKLLVYECFEKGSLEANMFQAPVLPDSQQLLNWRARFQIINGIAKALAYLHEDCLQSILHCDIKPANILLDNHFRPKVGDFGLACLYDRQHTLQVSTVRGTLGYMAPEWVSSMSITSKADIYSFGMLLLEIVSGRRNFLLAHTSIESERRSFPTWAYTLLMNGNLHEALDNTIVESGNGQEEMEMERALKVGLWCIQGDMNERPSMPTVIRMLEGVVNVQNPPPPDSILQSMNDHQSSTFTNPNPNPS